MHTPHHAAVLARIRSTLRRQRISVEEPSLPLREAWALLEAVLVLFEPRLDERWPPALRRCLYESPPHLLWVGPRNGATPIFRRDGRILRVPRVLWEAMRGPIPRGRRLVRECPDTRCVLPAHYMLVPPLP